jgi:hypothetical protein
MTKETIFYIKQGRKYIPHSTYSSEFCDSFPKGTHLVQSYPGGSLRRHNIEPKYAPMIAAGRVAEEAICKALMRASDMRTKTKPITQEQRDAWDHLVKVFGEEARCLEWPSAREACDAAINAMVQEANWLMENPMVKNAYDEFEATCKLVLEQGK